MPPSPPKVPFKVTPLAPLVSRPIGRCINEIVPFKAEAFRLYNMPPSPPKVPFKVTPLALLVSRPTGNCAGKIVPLMLAAPTERLVRPLPSPVKLPPFVSTGWPSTVMPAPPVTNRTPPLACTLNWLFVVEVNAPLAPSDQTKELSFVAWALFPSAVELVPLAIVELPIAVE